MQPIFALAQRRLRIIALCAFVFFAAVPLCFPQELSLDQRVDCRQALEAVRWENRIWPSSSVRAKPSLDEVMPRSVIAAAVQNDLRKSAALRRFWNRSITGEQLQAEIDRMARQSREPDVLRRLFAALGDDPRMIAECLARPLLTDRLLRNWYARDTRFHGALRTQIETELIRSGRAAGTMNRLTGAYNEVEWIRIGPGGGAVAGPDAGAGAGEDDRNVRRLGGREWDRMLQLLGVALQDDVRTEIEPGDGATWNPPAAPAPFGAIGVPASTDSLPLGRMSRLIERDDSFLVTAVLSRGVDRLTVASVTWRKQPFDAWWEGAARQVDPRVEAANFPYVLPDGDFSSCVGDSWLLTNTLAPLNRSEHTAVWTGTEMIIWGGYSGLYENTGGLYVPATDFWVPTSTTNAPAGRFRHTAVWTGTEMIVWGGQTGSGPSDYTATGGRYAPLTDSWSPTSLVSAPPARTFHTGIWTGSAMVVWGGYDGADLDTGGIYDPVGDSWTATSTTGAPAARYRHTALWSGTGMIVWGGLGGGSPLDSGARLDPGTNVWTAIGTAAAPLARESHTAVWDDTGKQMIVWGGRNNGVYLDSGGRYDPAMNIWSATTTTGAPDGRRNHVAVWDDTGNEMIVWGGYSGVFEDSGGRYDPQGDRWTATPTTGAPIARYLHSAVWTGTEMIVWGGSDGGRMSSGGRYDPAGDSWVPTANSQSPLLRHNHTALWTGAEMVVWGGAGPDSGGMEMNSGGRFDPATNSWLPTSFTNAPSARESHSAVWTGTEMIVWGGFAGQSGTAYDDGATYDPITDGWTAIASTAAPAARSRHTAVWAGDRMIVWGGETAAPVDLDSGGEYSPAGDSWSATPSTGAPSARSGHTAVWTGTEMIVWGGSATGTPLDTGAMYDPVGGWSPLPATGAPAARENHTAIWTGTEMIVWGGFGGPSPGALLDSGARYQPGLPAWTPTSTAGAPAPRQDHTAAWSGFEMIVWGGSGAPGALDSGGRYEPSGDSWMAMSVAGVPPARSEHTAVWTGTRVVIWGGLPPEVIGGAYCACVDASCIPAVALDLVFTDQGTLQWSATPGVTSYNMYRGSLTGGAWSYDHTCYDSGLTTPGASDNSAPALAAGFYYLVSGVGMFGEGNLGLASDLSLRPNISPCP